MKPNKFILKMIEEDGEIVTREFSANHIDDVVQQIKWFLIGCTYSENQVNRSMYSLSGLEEPNEY